MLGSVGSSVFAVLVPACTVEWVAEATEYRSLNNWKYERLNNLHVVPLGVHGNHPALPKVP